MEWNCDKCGGSTWVEAEGESKNMLKRCECYPRYVFMKNLEVSGIGNAFQRKTLDKFHAETEILDKIKRMVTNYINAYSENCEEKGNSLLLLGSVGSGKTHLGVSAAIELVKQGVGVIYADYRSEIRSLKQSILDKAEYDRRKQRLQSCQCLLIDDLFKGNVTETDIGYIYDIINHRYLEQLPVIVTSEKSVKELMSIDEAVASRMFEMAKGYIITMQGIGNYRLKQ